MRIDILTLFPEMVQAVLGESITGRALKNNLYELNTVNIRDFTEDKHRRVDDSPYGGGSGMVMEAQPIYDAFLSVRSPNAKVIYLSPQGQPFCQQKARILSEEQHLIFLCGHYEGVDERVLEEIVDEEISLGDFVLTGGEIAACAICDAVLRLIPGVLGNDASSCEESFENSLLEYPQYTRPEEVLGRRVPEVLLSGHHKNIASFRREKSLERTFYKRPDLLEKAVLSKEDAAFLEILKKRFIVK